MVGAAESLLIAGGVVLLAASLHFFAFAGLLELERAVLL
jgi:hypothetical protein